MSRGHQFKQPIVVLGSDDPGLTRIAVHAANRQLADIRNSFPVVEIIEDTMDSRDLRLMMEALEANGISVTPPSPPVKQPKRPVPIEVQKNRISAAEAKRERKRQKRLAQTQRK